MTFTIRFVLCVVLISVCINANPPDCSQLRADAQKKAATVLQRIRLLEEAEDDFQALREEYFSKEPRKKLAANRARVYNIRKEAVELQQRHGKCHSEHDLGRNDKQDVVKQLAELRVEFDNMVQVIAAEKLRLVKLKNEVFLSRLEVVVARGEKAKAIRDDFEAELKLKACFGEDDH